jgi:hypothetical protein
VQTISVPVQIAFLKTINDDEDSNVLVGAFICLASYREAAKKCVLYFKFWSNEYVNVRKCVIEAKPNCTELVKCNGINQKVSDCNDAECMIEKFIDLGVCLTSFLF